MPVEILNGTVERTLVLEKDALFNLLVNKYKISTGSSRKCKVFSLIVYISTLKLCRYILGVSCKVLEF